MSESVRSAAPRHNQSGKLAGFVILHFATQAALSFYRAGWWLCQFVRRDGGPPLGRTLVLVTNGQPGDSVSCAGAPPHRHRAGRTLCAEPGGARRR